MQVLNPERIVYLSGRRGSTEIVEPINPSEALDFLISIAQRYSGDLYINSIEYSSPGWLEIIGNLNPLKVVADIIANWRKENTERKRNEQQAESDERKEYIEVEKIQSQERIEREKIQSQERIEMAKLKTDFAKALLENGKPLRGISRPDNLERLLGLIGSSTEDTLSDIAKDTRVKNVKALPPSSKNSSADNVQSENSEVEGQ